jgi:predicted nucleic acid-binding protein
MMPKAAILDANVLYSAPLRDLLLQLAFAGLYQARWSAEIDDEWKRNLIAARPELADGVKRTQAAMHRALPDAHVTGYERLLAGLSLPDQGDRHVLAAAIEASAEVIVTFNLRDFPPSTLSPYGLVAQHPDIFLLSLAATAPAEVLAAAQECLGRLTQPPVTPDGYLHAFRRLGLTQAVVFLERNGFCR